MLLEFSVQNYRSIREMQTLSFIASPVKAKYPKLDISNIIDYEEQLKVLKSIAIYGANGSGKSNIVKALSDMLSLVEDSMINETLVRRIFFDKFNLNADTLSEPVFFQLQFVLDNKKFRYGFEINNSVVTAEWLYGPALKKEVYYFKREFNKISINKKHFTEAIDIPKGKTSETNLFLNVSVAYNGKVSKKIKNYLTNKILIDHGLSDSNFRLKTSEMLNQDESKKQILELLNIADFGINDIYEETIVRNIQREDVTHLPLKILKSSRNIFNNEGDIVGNRIMWMTQDESDGTNKMYNYSGAIIDSLLNGKALVLDEFDARLHPILAKRIVEMFNSPKLNVKNSQLLFMTHDTHLLDNSLLRRDQIYFTEKNTKGETYIYSLADINGVRNDASYEKDYIKGKYGGIPFVGDFETLFE